MLAVKAMSPDDRAYEYVTTGERRGPRTGPGGQAGEEKGAKETRKEKPVRREDRVEDPGMLAEKVLRKEGAVTPAQCCWWVKLHEERGVQLP